MSIWISTATQTDRFHTDRDCRTLDSAKRVQKTTRDAVNPRARECGICADGEQPGRSPGSDFCGECGRQVSAFMLEDGECIGCRFDGGALGGETP